MKGIRIISAIFIIYGCFIMAIFTKKNLTLETLLIGYLILIIGLIMRLIINIFISNKKQK